MSEDEKAAELVLIRSLCAMRVLIMKEMPSGTPAVGEGPNARTVLAILMGMGVQPDAQFLKDFPNPCGYFRPQ